MNRARRKAYLTAQWKSFRAEMIERDGCACTRCGHRQDDGAVLQVHHKEYVEERMPWEYSYEACETICKGCHAAEHGFVRPKTGWSLLWDEDLGGLDGNCENCGTEIRYVFCVTHPHWEPMEVGTVCCDNLTGTEEASQIEKLVKRRERFIHSKRWKAEDGRPQITQKGMKICIQEEKMGFRIMINGHHGAKRFPTVEEAKSLVFEVIENGQVEEYLKKTSEARGR